ncbi:uncharacterized protein LOC116194380 [Punica granatum]|uniref:Uncharacterized protein LOC116194380 n=2 Tax=Punica granatum TaxID=22663 RepID=A0A6P8CDQ2_PUNGR|nr:uncharacterized protein LOC116194380 [Punica granatum]XP_031379063.1 uncharacterized protein LOC116194380 [Punica granatum]XP_031379071.1 uncharacterized protein LOC116194380 [Punica granatum]
MNYREPQQLLLSSSPRVDLHELIRLSGGLFGNIMPAGTAVTHADLEPSRGQTDLGSKTGAVLVVWTILCGLFSFVLCLIAEATHSQVTWVPAGSRTGSQDGESYECEYSGSGKTPLMCSAGAFLVLATAMVVEHTYMLIAVSKLPPPAMVAYWEPEMGSARKLTWQAGFFFITTWVCFAVAEILLLIGLSVESGHLRNWSRPRPNCLVLREGLFCAAGVFALATVFMAAGLYITTLRMQRLFLDQAVFQREMLETSVLYASPPRSPPHRIVAVSREGPVGRDEQISDPPPVSSTVILSQKLSNILV